MDKLEIERQDLARNLVEKHVLLHMSMWVEPLEDSTFLFEDCENYYPRNEDDEYDEDGHYPEILEWWAVDDWLYRQLQYRNEIAVCFNSTYLWGRCCSGQSISMDCVIQDIAMNSK